MEKIVDGLCPYTNDEGSIFVKYRQTNILGDHHTNYKKIYFSCDNGNNCSHFNNCPLYNEAPSVIIE